jgi:hypothetical protein
MYSHSTDPFPYPSCLASSRPPPADIWSIMDATLISEWQEQRNAGRARIGEAQRGVRGEAMDEDGRLAECIIGTANARQFTALPTTRECKEGRRTYTCDVRSRRSPYPFLNEKDEKERGRAAGGREKLKRFYFRNRTEQPNKKQVWEFQSMAHGPNMMAASELIQ